MTPEEILTKVVEEDLLYKLSMNITKGKRYEWFDDMFHDIYIQLLTKDREKIVQLYKNDQMKFFLSRVLMNNIQSTTSATYRNYRKFPSKSEELRWDDESEDDDYEKDE